MFEFQKVVRKQCGLWTNDAKSRLLETDNCDANDGGPLPHTSGNDYLDTKIEPELSILHIVHVPDLLRHG